MNIEYMTYMVHSLIPEGAVGADLSCTSPIDRPWFSSTNFPNAPLSVEPNEGTLYERMIL